MKKELSIILPTLNEYENLKILVPELEKILEEEKFDNYEIIIVDDGSIDSTVDLINNFNKTNPNIKIFSRSSNPSLPLSIWEGINKAICQNVMWLDADGSMHDKAVKELVFKHARLLNVADEENIELIKDMTLNGLLYDFFGKNSGGGEKPAEAISEKDFEICVNKNGKNYFLDFTKQSKLSIHQFIFSHYKKQTKNNPSSMAIFDLANSSRKTDEFSTVFSSSR